MRVQRKTISIKLKRLNKEHSGNFFRNKYDSVEYIFERNKIMTAFEIYLMELLAEVFKQLRMESPLSSLNRACNHSYYTRRSKNGLLSFPYSQTAT